MKSNENEKNQTSVGITLNSHYEFSSDKDELAWGFYLKYYGESFLKNEKKSSFLSMEVGKYKLTEMYLLT